MLAFGGADTVLYGPLRPYLKYASPYLMSANEPGSPPFPGLPERSEERVISHNRRYRRDHVTTRP